MGLYHPGRHETKDRSSRLYTGAYSAVPRGRVYQLDFYPGRIVIDKAKDLGRESFAEDIQAARDDDTFPEEEVELLEKYGNLESGTAIWLGFNLQPGGRNFRINLAKCTEQELDAFRESMLRAVEVARPEVQRRDREAERARDEGFFGLYRFARSAPQVFEFGGERVQYDQKLSVGRKGVHSVDVASSIQGSEPDNAENREGEAVTESE